MTGPVPIPDVGTQLGRYQLLRRIGQGGMAVVFLAHDAQLDRHVAIKILHTHLSESQEAKDRFAREARAVAKLKHPNIVEIHDFSGAHGDASHISYIVTEFVDGQTLKQFVGKHPLKSPELAALIVYELLKGLQHAHACRILHRDVKPENVMLRADGAVKLMDFGISHMVDLERLTVTGQLLGSPAYMSPEHINGQPLDFRTDVFAVGIVLYQLATGSLPFSGKNAHEVLRRIDEGDFADPRRICPAIGNELGRIILRAMATRPDDRFTNVEAFAQALEAYLAGVDLAGQPQATIAKLVAHPEATQLELSATLANRLAELGIARMPTSKALALDAFDRALYYAPGHPRVTKALRAMKTAYIRRRLVLGILVAGALAASGVLLLRFRHTEAPQPSRALRWPDFNRLAAAQPPAITEAKPRHAAPHATPTRAPAQPRVATPKPAAPREAKAAPPPVPPAAPMLVRLAISPSNSEYRLNGGPWRTGARPIVDVSGGPVEISVRNDACCEPQGRTLNSDAAQRGTLPIILPYLPGQITPSCRPGYAVRINGRLARLDLPFAVPFGDTTQTQQVVTVEFVGNAIDSQRITLHPAEVKKVTCRL